MNEEELKELKELYEGITPESIERYLLANGFRKDIDLSNEKKMVFIEKYECTFMVIVPASIDIDDYLKKIDALIDILRLVLELPKESIIRDLKEDVYKDITPESIKKYLLSHGWARVVEEELPHRKYAKYQHENYDHYITAPINKAMKIESYYESLLNIAEDIQQTTGIFKNEILKGMKK